MSDGMSELLENAGALISVALMLIAGIGLLLRFVNVLRGRENIFGTEELSRNVSAREVLSVCLAALAIRLAVYGIAYGLYRILGFGADSFTESFQNLWTHWDVRHYIGIAEEGYTSEGVEALRLVFFPLYPILIRIFSLVTGLSSFFAGTAVSLLCASGCAGLLYDLCYPYAGREGALFAVGCLMLSPFSVFLNCVYTEALFLLLTLAVPVLLRRGHPWAAALCGMGSALTRVPGVIAAGFPLIVLFGKLGQKKAGWKDILSCCLQMLMIFSGFFIYLGINQAVTGNPFMYMTYQRENWFQMPGTFWDSVANTVHYVFATVGSSDHFWTWEVQLFCMVLVFLMLAFGQKLLPFDLGAYSFVYIAVVLCPTWLLSGARYLYAMAPLPLLAAKMIRSRALRIAVLGILAVLLIVWTYGYTLEVEVL